MTDDQNSALEIKCPGIVKNPIAMFLFTCGVKDNQSISSFFHLLTVSEQPICVAPGTGSFT